MITIKNIAVTAITVLALTGCAGDKPKPAPALAPAPPVADCTFPDAPSVAAPAWICDAPVKGVKVSAVGMAEKTGAGLGFQKNMAATQARVQLAQQMQVHVENMVKQYVETTGAGDSETVDKLNSSVTKQITKESLVGSRIYRSKISPSGVMYVLIGVDEENSMQTAQAALKTSMKNDRALWQQFKAKKGYEELAEEISKLQ